MGKRRIERLDTKARCMMLGLGSSLVWTYDTLQAYNYSRQGPSVEQVLIKSLVDTELYLSIMWIPNLMTDKLSRCEKEV